MCCCINELINILDMGIILSRNIMVALHCKCVSMNSFVFVVVFVLRVIVLV
jgi:hypothetical protein